MQLDILNQSLDWSRYHYLISWSGAKWSCRQQSAAVQPTDVDRPLPSFEVRERDSHGCHMTTSVFDECVPLHSAPFRNYDDDTSWKRNLRLGVSRENCSTPFSIWGINFRESSWSQHTAERRTTATSGKRFIVCIFKDVVGENFLHKSSIFASSRFK